VDGFRPESRCENIDTLCRGAANASLLAPVPLHPIYPVNDITNRDAQDPLRLFSSFIDPTCFANKEQRWK
jgi:hypothetical protein